jgi:hypothetical protein
LGKSPNFLCSKFFEEYFGVIISGLGFDIFCINYPVWCFLYQPPCFTQAPIKEQPRNRSIQIILKDFVKKHFIFLLREVLDLSFIGDLTFKENNVYSWTYKLHEI